MHSYQFIFNLPFYFKEMHVDSMNIRLNYYKLYQKRSGEDIVNSKENE